MLRNYLERLYRRTMDEAYQFAIDKVVAALRSGGRVLDCGAASGDKFGMLRTRANITSEQYTGVEWSTSLAEAAQANGINVVPGDLNKHLDFEDAAFDCVFGFSVLEHLINGCAWIAESRRVLRPGGTLVILTPNIATYFTAFTILRGRMPTTGPHPDSNILQLRNSYNLNEMPIETEGDTPSHRHMVVFSYLELRDFLQVAGFSRIEGKGFGHYPAPLFLQPLLERLDPQHCHQMVFEARA